MTPFFNADDITLENFAGWLPVRKKPIIVHAIQMTFPEGFEVTTMEGKVCGKPGDYLMLGVKGEKYPCAKEIFEMSYEVLAPSDLDEARRMASAGGALI